MERIKNKKGLDYVDWSMSFGLFLVAIIALFVFLKPGVQQPYDANNLISIVEKNFFAETKNVVKQTPLFIYHLSDKYNPGGLNAEIKVTLNGGWSFIDVQPKRTQGLTIVQQDTEITLDCVASCDNKNFTISWEPDQNAGDPSIELDCTPSGDKSSCDAALGSTITYEGLEQTQVDTLKAETSAAIKSRWNYPQTKEFAVYLDDVQQIGSMPPQEGNVVVRELNEWKIQGSTRVPIKVRFMVW